MKFLLGYLVIMAKAIKEMKVKATAEAKRQQEELAIKRKDERDQRL